MDETKIAQLINELLNEIRKDSKIVGFNLTGEFGINEITMHVYYEVQENDIVLLESVGRNSK